MTTLTATNARKAFFDLIKGANQRHEVYRINHKDGAVVMMSEEEYDGLQETLELLSVPGFREKLAESQAEVTAGEINSFEEVFGEPQ